MTKNILKIPMTAGLIAWLVSIMIFVSLFEWWSISVMLTLGLVLIFVVIADYLKKYWIIVIGLALEGLAFFMGYLTKTGLYLSFLIVPWIITTFVISKLYSNKK